MAVDLRIEVFSVDLYRSLWYKLDIKSFVLPRLKNYDKVTDQIACSDTVIQAVLCRRSFFSPFFWRELYLGYETYSKSSLDFYLFLQNNIDRFLLYELNIFDKVLMVGAVVLEMGCSCAIKFHTMYTYNCPLCFAMYFDTECKEEFYSKGGWRSLELHANTYKARVLTHPNNEESLWNCRIACNEAITIEYTFDHINRAFREKSLSGKIKTSCLHCLPLFHAIKVLSGLCEEVVTDFQITEGYLQIILRMLSQEDLRKREKHFLQGTKFETFAEVIAVGYSHIETNTPQKNELQGDEISYEKCLEYLCKYQEQNTHDFLTRLFKAQDDQDDTGDQCIFCARNVNELPKVFKSASDFKVEHIKAVIRDIDVSSEVSFKADNKKSPDKKNCNDIKEVLKLFFSLGVDPLKSNILINLEERSKSQTNMDKLVDSLAEIQIKNAPEEKLKENTGKKKRKKNKK